MYRECSKYNSNIRIKKSWVKCHAVRWDHHGGSSIRNRQQPGNKIASETFCSKALGGLRQPSGVGHDLWQIAFLCASDFLHDDPFSEWWLWGFMHLKVPELLQDTQKIFSRGKCSVGATTHGSQSCKGRGYRCKALPATKIKETALGNQNYQKPHWPWATRVTLWFWLPCPFPWSSLRVLNN